MDLHTSEKVLSYGLQKAMIDRQKLEANCKLSCSFQIMTCERAFTNGMLKGKKRKLQLGYHA
jgi:hypothetical protein